MCINKYVLISILLSCLLFTVLSCSEDDPANELASEILANKRTMLIYMVADNNLSSDAERNLRDLKTGLSVIACKNDVFVYFDGEPDIWNSDPVLLKLSYSEGTVKTDTIVRYAEANSASRERLSQVLDDFIRLKDRTLSCGLLLWSHGTGWLPACFPNCPDNIQMRSFGEDEVGEGGEPPEIQSLDIMEMADAIPGNVFDYIIFDACLMQSVEVAYELRNKTNYIFAGASLTPASGLPYLKIPSLFLEEHLDYKFAAQTIFAEYEKAEKQEGGVSFSLVQTSELKNLADVTHRVFDKYSTLQRNSPESGYIQGFDYAFGEHIFYDFMDYVRSFAQQDDVALIEKQLKNTVTFSNSTKTVLSGRMFFRYPRLVKVNTFSGLSINKYGDKRTEDLNWYYSRLNWCKDVYN